MKRNMVVRILVVLCLILAVGFGVHYYEKRRQAEEAKELVLYGNVDIREVDLGFRVMGRVELVLFDEGDHINTGDLIAVLDKIPYLEEVARGQAQVQALTVAYANAEKQFARRNKAITTSAISEEDFENSLANQEEIEATLEAAEAALAQSLTRLNDTEMYAPSNGIILTRIREPGSVLNVGEPVFTVSLDSPIWIRAYVSEPDLGKIYPDMPANIYTDTKTSPVYHGHIGFISPVAEFTPKNVETTELRTDLVYRLRIIVDDANTGLRQGMPVTVKFPKHPSKNTEAKP